MESIAELARLFLEDFDPSKRGKKRKTGSPKTEVCGI